MIATQSIKKSIGWLDENFENVFMFIAYFTIMSLMAGSVMQRFIFRTQMPQTSMGAVEHDQLKGKRAHSETGRPLILSAIEKVGI